jgi:large subunit ribosomal protein L24
MIKKGEEVTVLCGKSKGTKGMVLSIDRKNQRAIVSGVNLHKKHLKPTKDRPGEVVLKELSMHLSNLSVIK